MMFHRIGGLRRVHFVGIGGAGMSGIAELLLDLDELEISGSDLNESEATRRLERLGAKVTLGEHSADNVAGADLVVRSSAVPATNVELVAARDRGVTIVRRAEMLAELMRLKCGIAIAGTHGKTTTTSLIGTMLTETGLDPTVLVGGRLRLTGTGARRGGSDYLVAEADEFDRSFLSLTPVLAVITNVDLDHLDTYADLAEIEDAFATFASRVPFFGQVIACVDDLRLRALLPRLEHRRVRTYGLLPQADLRADSVETTERGMRFDVVDSDSEGLLCSVDLPLPGVHNVRNALAAVAVGRAVGLDGEEIARGLAAFEGVHRRFERLGTFHGAEVIDDYAHHPTELQATLVAARERYDARIHAVFQPHLYSRTRDLAGQFGQALLLADSAWVTDVYGSREAPIEGVTGELIVDAARAAGHRGAHYVPAWAEIESRLATVVGEGDAVLTMGAGDIYRLGRDLARTNDPRGAS